MSGGAESAGRGCVVLGLHPTGPHPLPLLWAACPKPTPRGCSPSFPPLGVAAEGAEADLSLGSGMVRGGGGGV